MDPIRKQARIAGLLYFVAGITAPFSLLYVPRTLIVPGDATATANHLRTSESLLRLGMASEIFVAVMFIFVVLALYHLFKRVSMKLSLAMAVLLLVSVPISMLNVLNDVAALVLVSGPGFLSSFNAHQLDSLAYLFLRLHSQGLQVAAIFSGLWLFPFGFLVMRSDFIPRLLGVLLLVAGCGYVAGALAALLLPAHARLVAPFAMALEFGEMPIAFWLLIWGAKTHPSAVPAA